MQQIIDRAQYWRQPAAEVSSAQIVPNESDPFAGVPTKAQILENAFKVDVTELYQDLLARYPEAEAALAATGADPRVETPQENMYLALLTPDLKSRLVERFLALETEKYEALLAAGKPAVAPKNILAPERFDNAGLHNALVGLGVEAVAKNLFPGDAERQRECTLLGAVHDANKTAERQRNNLKSVLKVIESSTSEDDRALAAQVWAKLDEAQSGLANAVKNPDSKEAYDQYEQFMISKGVKPEIVALVLKAGEISGHGSFSLLTKGLLPKEGFEVSDDLLPALLVHAVDDHISSPFDRSASMILTVRERMIASDFHSRYGFMKVEGIGIAEDNRVVDIKDVSNPPPGVSQAVSYMNFQPLLADAINILIAKEMGIEDADPQTFLRDLLVSAFAKAE